MNWITRLILRKGLEALMKKENRQYHAMQRATALALQARLLYPPRDTHAVALGLKYDVLQDLRLFLDEVDDNEKD